MASPAGAQTLLPHVRLGPWPFAPRPLSSKPWVPKTWFQSLCCLPLLHPERGAGLLASSLCLASAGTMPALQRRCTSSWTQAALQVVGVLFDAAQLVVRPCENLRSVVVRGRTHAALIVALPARGRIGPPFSAWALCSLVP